MLAEVGSDEVVPREHKTLQKTQNVLQPALFY